MFNIAFAPLRLGLRYRILARFVRSLRIVDIFATLSFSHHSELKKRCTCRQDQADERKLQTGDAADSDANKTRLFLVSAMILCSYRVT